MTVLEHSGLYMTDTLMTENQAMESGMPHNVLQATTEAMTEFGESFGNLNCFEMSQFAGGVRQQQRRGCLFFMHTVSG